MINKPCPICAIPASERGLNLAPGFNVRCAFPDEGMFYSANWMCGTLGRLWDFIERTHDGLSWISVNYYDDWCTVLIRVADLLPDGVYQDLWVMRYKQRGTTNAMWLLGPDLDPRPPTLAEMEHILDGLQQRLG